MNGRKEDDEQLIEKLAWTARLFTERGWSREPDPDDPRDIAFSSLQLAAESLLFISRAERYGLHHPGHQTKLTTKNLERAAELAWLVASSMTVSESLGLEEAHKAIRALDQKGLRQGFLVELVETGLRLTGDDRAGLIRFLADTLPGFDAGWRDIAPARIAEVLEGADIRAGAPRLALALLQETNPDLLGQLSGPSEGGLQANELANAVSRLRKRRNPE